MEELNAGYLFVEHPLITFLVCAVVIMVVTVVASKLMSHRENRQKKENKDETGSNFDK
jgi:NADH:ubiquinone oxidoreductase subunit 3 (subunit A)